MALILLVLPILFSRCRNISVGIKLARRLFSLGKYLWLKIIWLKLWNVLRYYRLLSLLGKFILICVK